MGAYLLPTITLTLIFLEKLELEYLRSLITISCLILDIKFILFFRAFESFGIYFAIIFGVARKVFSFLFVLFLIITSFAHAFITLLQPNSNIDLDSFNPEINDLNDTNNPWSLTNKYFNDTSNQLLIEKPDEYTNLFVNYQTSLLVLYLFLTGIYIFFLII